MSFKPLHDIDSGTVTINSFVPISDGTSVEKCTTKQLISAGLGNGSDIQFSTNNLLVIKDGSIDSGKLTANAVTADKIADGEIDLSKLKSSGERSIPINLLKRKTVCVHVGNYYRNGIRITADDSYNYDSSFGGFYGERTGHVVNQNDPDSLNYVWAGTFQDSTELHIEQSFATLSAAARFLSYNYGPNLNAIFLIHGHVCAIGEYDLDGRKNISRVNTWESFSNIAILSGSTPNYTASDAHTINYMDDQATLARIDWDHDIKSSASDALKELAFNFNGPNVMISGVNIVFHSDSNFSSVYNKFTGGEHHINGVRISASNDIDHLVPYYIERSANMFFGKDGLDDISNEFYFQEDGRLFIAKDNSNIYYGVDSNNNDILLEAYKTEAKIKFISLELASTLQMGSSLNDFEVKIKNDSNLSTNVSPIYFNNGNNTIINHFSASTYLFGGYITFENGSSTDKEYDNSTGSIGFPSSRKNYTTLPATSLLKRHTGTKHEASTKASLLPAVLAGNSSPKSAPSARSANPYSDQ